ncbi:MAG: preprotein translocase subunit SecE [Acidimicrobiaceae bacterium]|nr:preprotein translocase subunit SecE [Actinomycetota bacterium]MCB0981488.1 preprotein translocase subunit SecE [Ilumatobacter sp.]MCB9380460.1 preprotein translocase subunit SecE [Acidimicrobiaceae bacterium]MCO5329639.1 preprotein translocase subunit SecE [Ilumatobacteraceae bacterium]
MSLDDLNREQKRTLKKMGALNDQGQPTRAPAPARQKRDRVGAFQYVREVRDEMRKVAWPKWPEVRRFSIIVLVTVVLYTGVVFGLDSLFGVLSGWLYD